MIALTGLLFGAAITPGPNNFIVMGAGARGGARAVASAGLGVLLGSLVMLALAWSGLAVASRAYPAAFATIGVAGALYLAWLGVSLILRPSRPKATDNPASQQVGLPRSLLGIAAFQLVNPKAWVLIATAVGSAERRVDAPTLAILVTLVTLPCLGLWGFAGAALRRMLAGPAAKAWFDRAMGAVLLISAAALAVESHI